MVTLFSLAAHFPGEIVASFREHGFFSLFSRAAVSGLGSGADVRFLQETTWGDADSGGDSRAVAAQLSGGVHIVVGNFEAFAAVKVDGSVVTWGI